jgi:hypothetical protein
MILITKTDLHFAILCYKPADIQSSIGELHLRLVFLQPVHIGLLQIDTDIEYGWEREGE